MSGRVYHLPVHPQHFEHLRQLLLDLAAVPVVPRDCAQHKYSRKGISKGISKGGSSTRPAHAPGRHVGRVYIRGSLTRSAPYDRSAHSTARVQSTSSARLQHTRTHNVRSWQ